MRNGRPNWRSVTYFALSLPAVRLCMAVAALTGLSLCLVPLLGVHGAESALALGIILPPFVAIAAARVFIGLRRNAGPFSGLDLALGGLCVALLTWAIPVLILGLNALRVKNCSPVEGLLFMALGPAPGLCLAALVGLCCASAIRSERGASLAAAAIPLGGIVLGLWRFYSTPAVFSYGHFFGFFAGSVYDEIVGISAPLLSLRLLTLSLAIGLLGLLIAHHHPNKGAFGLVSRSPLWTGICVLSALIFLIGEHSATRLGHTSSAAHIAEILGARVESARCDLIVPRELHTSRVSRLAAECDFRVRQMERWFGVRQQAPVRVFMFRSAAEKRSLMGAATTNIAKPWRHEVYLQITAWPHPVLAHEIAHVVVGNVGTGPFKIAGSFSGLLPDPNLIEGAAVAAAWGQSGELTPHQWARASIELDRWVGVEELTGAGFLATQKRLAYTLSGSLLRFIADTHGIEALRRIYRGESIEIVVGQPTEQLERRWREFVAQVQLPDSARGLAELRFAGGSIFSAVCPHRVASLKARLGADLAAGDDLRAAQTCGEILQTDDAQTGTRAALIALNARLGDEAGVRRELAKLVGPPAAESALIARARQSLADEMWRAGRPDEAHVIYDALLREPMGRDSIRPLQVKVLARDGTERQAQLLFDLFIGKQGLPPNGATIVHIARELRSERGDGLPHYLEARQLLGRQRFAEAAQLLREARGLGLPSTELWDEALRLQAASLFGSGELAAARRVVKQWARDAGPGPRAEADDWLARIDDGLAHAPSTHRSAPPSTPHGH